MILRGKLVGRFVEQADRGQSTLLPECLDDFVTQAIRFGVIDVFVDTLDLAEIGFDGAEPGGIGASVVSSVGSLEALHLDGYLGRVQSSRQLER